MATADEFDAGGLYAEVREELVALGFSPTEAVLRAAATTVFEYLISRRDDRDLAPFLRSLEDYVRILAGLFAVMGETEAEGQILEFATIRASFDLSTAPSRRAPASLFLERHGESLPGEARSALTALLRAQDEFTRIEEAGGVTFATRLRDGRRLPSGGALGEPVSICIGRLVELDGRFFLFTPVPADPAAAKRWRDFEEWVCRERERHPGRFPRHRHPRKATLYIGLVSRLLGEVTRRSREARPSASDRRRYAEEWQRVLADPEVRKEDARWRREMSRAWCERPEPSLGGHPPRKVAATASGRKRLGALLDEMERNPFARGHSLDFRLIRQRLGLPTKPPAER